MNGRKYYKSFQIKIIWNSSVKSILAIAFRLSGTVKLRQNVSSQTKMFSRNFFVKSLSQHPAVTFTKFLPKMRESKFPQFLHCVHGIIFKWNEPLTVALPLNIANCNLNWSCQFYCICHVISNNFPCKFNNFYSILIQFYILTFVHKHNTIGL